MITIDGTAGGGQMLRTALGVSAVTGRAFRIENVRGARPTPGLRPQHLAAVDLVARVCDASVEGASLGSETVTVRPGTPRAVTTRLHLETAGSVTLVFDAALPVAAALALPLSVTAVGGTDVQWAPPMDYYRRVKLPLLAEHHVAAAVDVTRRGFYPVGGGEATLRTGASVLTPFDLRRRGRLRRVDVFSTAAASLAERRVAERQAERASERLAAAGLPHEVRRVESVPARSPGSALVLRADYEASLAGAAELGERGRSSEAVADAAVDELLSFHAGTAAVDEWMADQLLVFLALAGGRVRVPRVTAHVRSSLDVLAAFGCDVRVEGGTGEPTVVARPHPAAETLPGEWP